MTLRLIGMAKTNARILALTTAAPSLCSLVPATFAQGPIRVETNQVLVPVVVIKKEEYSRMLRDPRTINDAVLPGEVAAIASGLLVHDLTTADFQVLDDSKEQPIRTVTEEPSLSWNVRDNTQVFSRHTPAHSFALSCTFLHPCKTQLSSSQAIPHSFPKNAVCEGYL
jgi:hypothetical protein